MTTEVFTAGNLDAVDELVSPDFVDHSPLPGAPPTRDGFKGTVRMLRDAFSGMSAEVVHTLIEGDTGVDHPLTTGKHTGEFMGIPPSGKDVTMSAIVISRIGPDGRIAERWQQFSAFSLLQQLGAVPGWEAPPPARPLPDADPAATTPEQNRQLFLAQIERIWNDGDLDAADELFHPDAIAPDAPMLPPGPDGCKVAAKMFRDAFPDFHVDVVDTIAEGDLVCGRLVQRGTHRGELFGIPPTGRSVEFEEIALVQVGDGKIVGSWFQSDLLGLMGQLGAG